MVVTWTVTAITSFHTDYMHITALLCSIHWGEPEQAPQCDANTLNSPSVFCVCMVRPSFHKWYYSNFHFRLNSSRCVPRNKIHRKFKRKHRFQQHRCSVNTELTALTIAMSAEAGHKTAYSADLHWRVVWQCTHQTLGPLLLFLFNICGSHGEKT